MATEDKLHQDRRANALPHLKPIIAAAVAAGAVGAFLSGAGPSVLALCDAGNDGGGAAVIASVNGAMEAAAQTAGVCGRVISVLPSSRGAHLVDELIAK